MKVHSVLVAQQSSALKSLVNEAMQEARTGIAVWEDVDEETFARFARYMNSEDYAISVSPQGTSDEADLEHEPPLMSKGYAQQFPVEPVAKTFRKIPPGGQCSYGVGFDDLQHDFVPRFIFQETYPDFLEDFKAIFMGHARLYVLADKCDITRLKCLVLSKLHAILQAFTRYTGKIGEGRDVSGIIELLRYAYDNTAVGTI